MNIFLIGIYCLTFTLIHTSTEAIIASVPTVLNYGLLNFGEVITISL